MPARFIHILALPFLTSRSGGEEGCTLVVVELPLCCSVTQLVQLHNVGVAAGAGKLVTSPVEAEDQTVGWLGSLFLPFLCGLAVLRAGWW